MSTPSDTPGSPGAASPFDADPGTARRDSFVALLAHEIRNPLAPIRSGVALLKSPLVSEPVRAQTLQMMERQLSHLVRLVDDLLASVSMQRGDALATVEHVRLADVLQAAIQNVQPSIQAKAQVLGVDGGDTPVLVAADPRRLAQAFANILNTSSKTTPWHGTLHIEVEARNDADTVVILFSDSGPGIPRDERAGVFELYRTSNSAIVEELGIGLALVRGLVEMNGGTIEVADTDADDGSLYAIRLPVVRGTELPQRPPPDNAARPWRAQRVLVVDDNRDAAQTLGALLELDGHTIRIAGDGPSAVAQAGEFRPELVLMDIGLPGFSGLVATQQIRRAQLAPRATIVALTGWGSPADRAATRAAGCDHHLVKPVDYQEIAHMLTLALAQDDPKDLP